MGYLICDKCGGYYELQPGESPDQFTDSCDCGGKLKYFENLESSDTKNMEEMTSTIICPRCGTENPEEAKLCKSCKRLLKTSSIPPKNDENEKSGSGILETWNQQSNGIKAISVIGICCIGLILIVAVGGMFSSDKNTNSLNSSPNTTSPSTTQSNSAVTNYANQMKDISQRAQSVLQDVTDVSNDFASGTIDAETTISRLQNDKTTMDSLLSKMQGLNPPSGLQHAHSLYLSAFQDIDNALGLSIDGLKKNDTNEINQGTDAMKSAGTKLDQANSEIQSYNP